MRCIYGMYRSKVIIDNNRWVDDGISFSTPTLLSMGSAHGYLMMFTYECEWMGTHGITPSSSPLPFCLLL